MPTYTPLQSIQLASSSATVTFSNIPQTYQDLVLVSNPYVNVNADLWIRCNGDTASNYSYTVLFGTGSTSGSARDSNNVEGLLTDYYGIPGTEANISIVHINNYSNNTTFKTALSRANRASNGVDAVVSLWRNTQAINSLTLRFNGNQTFSAGSTFDLYGISPVAADTAQAFGGTEVYYDNSYVYHVFKGSGTFIPYRSLTTDILVVAGGGGGGAACGGGGGAGGVLEHTSQSLTTQNYTVLVGAGGPGGTLVNRGTNGQNSQFGSLTASVGGGNGGAGGNPTEGKQVGGNGGSGGGGGGGFSGATAAGGTAQSGQGNNGGTSNSSGPGYAGGGGGGKGGAGAQGTSTVGGAGGAGSNTWSSWLSIVGLGVSGFIAGGGGGGIDQTGNTGGTAGSGGAGAGGRGGVAGSNAVMQTGSGGGGGGDTSATVGGSGASGFVIVRYAR